MNSFTAQEASKTADKARRDLASTAEMSVVLRCITEDAKQGKYSCVLNGLTEGQVFRLQELGYSVNWNGAGTFATVCW